jgi:hypothetical protein
VDEQTIATDQRSPANSMEMASPSLPQPPRDPPWEPDPSISQDEYDLIRWLGEGGNNGDYDPSRWGRRL